EVRAMPRRVRVDRAILRAGAATVVLRAGTGYVPAIVGLNVTADLETNVTARNGVETSAVEIADLHVLDRLGLDRKIGSLRPRTRDKSCRGAEEKISHYLHSNLQVAHRWRVPRPPGRLSPEWNAPQTGTECIWL